MPRHRKAARLGIRLTVAVIAILIMGTGIALAAVLLSRAVRQPATGGHPHRPPAASPVPSQPRPAISSPVGYSVRSGDTLWSIARRYCGSGGDALALAAANHLPRQGNSLKISQVLIIAC